jgi:hypothetical protein
MTHLFSPRWAIAASFAVWAILRLMAPISYDVSPSPGAVLLLASYVGFFFAGTFLYSYLARYHSRAGDASLQVTRRTGTGDFLDRRYVRAVFLTFLTMALIGLALRFYDLIAAKSFFSFESVSDFKINYDEGAVVFGPASVVSAILVPFSAALLLLTSYFKERLALPWRAVAYATLALFVVYFALRGGRTAITLMLLMFLTGLALSGRLRTRGLRTGLNKKLIVLGIVLLVFFVYSMSLLTERLEIMGFTATVGLEYLESYHHVIVSDAIWDLAEGSGWLAAAAYTAVSLTHYVIHGYYQFFLLIQTFDTANLTWGATQFYPLFKFFGVLGFDTISAAQLFNIVEEPGVYSTFFGPVYMDFGYWGFLYCFLLGVICQLSWRKAQAHDPFHLMLYPYCASVLFHSSFLNMIRGGMGVYFLAAMILAGLILKLAARYFVSESLDHTREKAAVPS